MLELEHLLQVGDVASSTKARPRFEQCAFPFVGALSAAPAESAPASADSLRPQGCIFCAHSDPEINSVIRRRGTMFARWDNFPAAPGHIELVPFRHVASFFDMTEIEIKDLRILAITVRDLLLAEYSPDGFTLGVNDGAAAGRSVHHLHFHIIPRWHGDVEDPTGGIRQIFPDCNPSLWLGDSSKD